MHLHASITRASVAPVMLARAHQISSARVRTDRATPTLRHLLGALVAVTAISACFAVDDSCAWSGDSVCDDPQRCTVGTDCTDCGTCSGTTAAPSAPQGSVFMAAIFRDMTSAHPDFKTFNGGGENNCVETFLGANNKPVLSGSCSMFTTSENFDQW
jgi:hypothetical protein